MMDIPFAHSAAGCELDSIKKTAIRQFGRAVDPRIEFKWRTAQYSLGITASAQAQNNPRANVAVEPGGRLDDLVLFQFRENSLSFCEVKGKFIHCEQERLTTINTQ